MGDFSCGPVSSSYPESLMSVPPENVCREAENVVAVSKPEGQFYQSAEDFTEDQFSQPWSDGRSVSSHAFLDPSEQVCRQPETLPEAQLCQSREPIPESRFTATLSESKMIAELDIEAKDIDGAQNLSSGDLQGVIKQGTISVNQDLFAPAFEALKGSSSENKAENTKTLIKDVYFDAKDKAYVLKLEVTKTWEIPYFFDPSVWDNFEVRFKANDQGQLVAQLDDNWMPDSSILSQLEHKIRAAVTQQLPEKYQAVRFDIQQQGNQLTLQPQVKNLEVPLAGQGALKIDSIDSKQTHVSFDQQGNLHLKLDQVVFKGSTGSSALQQKPSTQPDYLNLHARLALGKDNQRQAYAQGKITLDLDETETPNIRLGHDKLSDFMQSGTLNSDFSLYLKQEVGKNPEIENQSELNISNANLGSGQTVDLHTSLRLKFDPQTGLELDPVDYDYAPLRPNTTANGVEFFVNGEDFYPEMKQMIANAHESIALETFMFMDDEVGHELATLLARKAAGLEPKGPLKVSKDSPDGVDIRFIFNSWKGNLSDGEASARLLEDAKADLRKELKRSGLSSAQQEKTIARMEQNLNWKFFTEGILRSDHRKVLVVDGAQATVGGMNLGEKYLSEDGYHDVSIKVAGPEVRQIHKEFLENWFAFNGQPQPSESQWQSLLKKPEELERALEELQVSGAYAQKANVQMLVTDDQQVDIERGLVHLIDSAQTEINIQQAFFSDETINRHLAEAMQRGVKINVVVAREPLAASVFTAANLLSVYELAKLKQAGAPGDIHLYYYDDPSKGHRAQIHTKAMTIDGQQAIVGSANMIGRSLSSPFWQTNAAGEASQAMFNKEMSLMIDGAEFVEEINQRLFHYDMQNQSQELDAEAIAEEVKKAGGESTLRSKALAAPFT